MNHRALVIFLAIHGAASSTDMSALAASDRLIPTSDHNTHAVGNGDRKLGEVTEASDDERVITLPESMTPNHDVLLSIEETIIENQVSRIQSFNEMVRNRGISNVNIQANLRKLQPLVPNPEDGASAYYAMAFGAEYFNRVSVPTSSSLREAEEELLASLGEHELRKWKSSLTEHGADLDIAYQKMLWLIKNEIELSSKMRRWMVEGSELMRMNAE